MKKLKLVISRKKWGRGAEGGSLLNDNGLMCCLGFAAKKDGHTKILYLGMPSDLFDRTNRKVKKGGFLERLLRSSKSGDFLVDTPVCKKLAKINDDVATTDYQKEKKIIQKFDEVGIKITFVD